MVGMHPVELSIKALLGYLLAPHVDIGAIRWIALDLADDLSEHAGIEVVDRRPAAVGLPHPLAVAIIAIAIGAPRALQPVGSIIAVSSELIRRQISRCVVAIVDRRSAVDLNAADPIGGRSAARIRRVVERVV